MIQWPGSYCDTKQSCCYPTTGKPPSDFGIHGLWPNYKDGSYPSNCDPNNSYDQSKVYSTNLTFHICTINWTLEIIYVRVSLQISDLISRMQQDWATLACPSNSGSTFWSHEWDKHGTCSESVLDQHAYFATALNLKSKLDLLQILQSAGNNSIFIQIQINSDPFF